MIEEMVSSLTAANLDKNNWFITLVVLILSLTIFIPANLILWVGQSRRSDNRTNIWHRAFNKYDSSKLARLIVLFALFFPTISIFIANLLLTTSSIFEILFIATIPCTLCSMISLVDLRYKRRYPAPNQNSKE